MHQAGPPPPPPAPLREEPPLAPPDRGPASAPPGPPDRTPIFRRPAPDQQAGASVDRSLEANAYAIAYRLVGDRAAAGAVAGIAAQRVRHEHLVERPDWLCHLTLFTLDQTVPPNAPRVEGDGDDPYAGLRAALRRRLARATPQERIAGALVHLAGYPPGFVGDLLGCDEQRAADLAGILAPPPGVAYRQLGDPQLTRTAAPELPGARSSRRRPRWTTIAVVVAVLAAIVAATQFTGPRPTLGPPVEEGGAGVVVEGGPDVEGDGGPDVAGEVEPGQALVDGTAVEGGTGAEGGAGAHAGAPGVGGLSGTADR